MVTTMKLFKCVLQFALASCCLVTSIHAAGSSLRKEKNIDLQKNQITEEKDGNLRLSGEVRGEWKNSRAWTRGQNDEGVSERNSIHTNKYDTKANLIVDYRADRTWGKIQLQFEPPKGEEKERSKSNHENKSSGSGKPSHHLRKAYMGYNVFEGKTSRFDFELGRWRLYDSFDSKIQFYSYYNGITLKYANSLQGLTDFQFKTAGFVADQSASHLDLITEVGFLNLVDKGLDLKYSFIHWNKKDENRQDSHFNNSQVTLTYNLPQNFVHFKSQVYGAFLHNHSANETQKNHHKKQANAWYAGMRVGEIKKQNDWAFDANYQWVEQQAIPKFDARGIGRDIKRTGGLSNYKGYSITGFYALTDNLTLESGFDRIEQCHRVTGKHHSYSIQLAVIYAF
jgi:hypothetical protein